MIEKTKSDPRLLIKSWLELNERSIRWLSEKTGIERSHLYRVIIERSRPLTLKSLDKINEVLETSYYMNNA